MLAGGGIALLCCGTGGLFFGGVALAAGLSTGVNTIKQSVSNEEFDSTQVILSGGSGMLVGLISGPISAGGGLIAAGFTGAGKAVVTVGTGAIAGGTASAGQKCFQNLAEKKEDITEDLLNATITGVFAGGLGAFAGKAASGVTGNIIK